VVPVAKSHFRAVLVQMGWQTAYRDQQAEVLLPPAQMGRVE
jgi:hypothetical protein